MVEPKHQHLREQVVETCRDMVRLGLTRGTSGNVSVRLPPSAEGYLVTPSGIGYDQLTPDQIVEMDFHGGYDGDWLPSSEWRLHRDIYAHRPEAGAVVHAHPDFATDLACLRLEIPAFHYMVAVAGGSSIRCADYATFGTQALSDHMLKALAGRSACLLAHHGMIGFAPTLTQALRLADVVEALARQYWHVRQAGPPLLLPDEEMQVVLDRFRSYGRPARTGEPAAVDGCFRRPQAGEPGTDRRAGTGAEAPAAARHP